MIVPDDGDKLALSRLLGVAGVDVVARLFQNDFTPDRYSVLGDFTEADFTDYTPLSPGGWTSPAVDGTGVAYVVSPALVWSVVTPTVGNTIYGIYFTVNFGGVDRIIAAERFALPLPMHVAGQQIARQVTYTSRRAA